MGVEASLRHMHSSSWQRRHGRSPARHLSDPDGCCRLEALLGGGLREGQLTEIAGESSSGKTQILMQVRHAVRTCAHGGPTQPLLLLPVTPPLGPSPLPLSRRLPRPLL